MKARADVTYGSLKNISRPVVIISIVFLCFFIIFWPMDSFSHGYFCDDELPSEQIDASTTGYIDLEEMEAVFTFSPRNKHFAGFEIYLDNQYFSAAGVLLLNVYDETGEIVDSIETALKDIEPGIWYKTYADKNLKNGRKYTVHISAKGCSVYPKLPLVNAKLLPDETVSGNILIGYAYAHSVFTADEKALISLFVLAVWGLIMYSVILSNRHVYVKYISLFLFFTTALSWNYMYNSMDVQNTRFSTFQADSETLVTGKILAEHNGIVASQRYNLGRYSDVKGDYRAYTNTEYVTDEIWNHGYNLLRAGIVIPAGIYSSEVASVGNSVIFFNDIQMKISEVVTDDTYIEIYFDTDQLLDYNTCGSLDHIRFLDADGNEMNHSVLSSYKSQYGLQGRIFKFIAGYLKYDYAVGHLRLLCSFASAFVFMLIVCMIGKKYNHLLAGCFFVTFLLSPWIVNFGRNLYWVEFTWFLPMVAGLFCAWQINSKKARILSYAATFVFIMVKSLCGYEYITVVMMGSIAFMLVDFLTAAVKRDKKQSMLLFRTIFFTGIAALFGFIAAICIHADLRGEGNILEGIKLIFEQDVLRRTYGADLNNFVLASEGELHALTASVWEVLSRYFHFETEVITGIAGNLFPLLCMIPLFIFVGEYKAGRVCVEQIFMYIVFFLTSVSWFVLAKSHSCVHTHMNYVLWYFGFVQICLYIILDKIVAVYREMCEGRKKN